MAGSQANEGSAASSAASWWAGSDFIMGTTMLQPAVAVLNDHPRRAHHRLIAARYLAAGA